MCSGPEKVKERRIELNEEMHAKGDPNTKLKYYFYELVEEMYARGITFAPITLEDSLGTKFARSLQCHLRTVKRSNAQGKTDRLRTVMTS